MVRRLSRSAASRSGMLRSYMHGTAIQATNIVGGLLDG
jgi:hypothetical protein